MLVKSPAIVLRMVDYSESSRIVTFLTPDYGKTAIMIKGFRRKGSRYTGLVTLGAVLDIQYYHKDTRSVQTMGQAETRIKTLGIQTDFNKLALAMSLLELADMSLHEHEPNPVCYRFLESFLAWLNQSEGDVRVLFPYLQARIAEINGVGLQFEGGDSGADHFLNIITGTISENAGEGLSFRLKPVQSAYLEIAIMGGTSRLLNYDMPDPELKSLIRHLDIYLKHHIEGLRDRKSDAIFEQILDQ